MRVHFVIDSLNSGGAQQQLVRVFNGLRARGIDAWLSYYYPHHHFIGQIPGSDRDRVHCTDAPDGASAWTLARHVRREIERIDADVVVSFLRGVSTLVGLARLTRDFRWIASERFSRLDLDPFVRRQLYARTLRLADRVAPNARTALPELRDAGLPDHRLVWLPNGIEVHPDALAVTPRPPEQPLRLLAVGTLIPRKNYVPLLRVLATMKDRSWVLDHLGRNDEDPDELLAVERIVRGHGLEGRVRLHGRQSDVGRWYAQAHLLVHPSGIEGFPNVILEAWEYACPVLVSDVGEMPLLVEHDRTGFITSIDSDDALAIGVRHALDRSADLGTMGAAGRQELLDRYTMDVALDRWEEALDEVARAPGFLGRLTQRSVG